MGISNRSTDRLGRRRWAAWAVACLVVLIPLTVQAEQAKPKVRAMVGAYYFDGWSGKTNHVTKLLETEFADRKPVWGWNDDTVAIMQRQIDYCADHGIAFWAFDWYYPEGQNKTTPLNNALGLYVKAPNRQRLEFCLLSQQDKPPSHWPLRGERSAAGGARGPGKAIVR
jgi:hypothetical protein